MSLVYFQPLEFDLTKYGGEDWWSRMSPELLNLLDHIRHLHNGPIMISPHAGALGRYMRLSYSDHNVDRWKEVRAADVFPVMHQTQESAYSFLEVCRTARAGAIGCYPHWVNASRQQQVGFHIGYRPDRTDDPSLWGMIRYKRRGTQHMVPIMQAISRVGLPPVELP